MSKNIFLTAGTQLPFERLLAWVNSWAESNRNTKVLAQACNITGNYEYLQTVGLMAPKEYSEAIANANLLIGHAGIGTIITAHERELPLIIVPREYSLGEHRNNHQVATADKFKGIDGIYVAQTEESLHRLLERDDLNSCSTEESSNRQLFVSELKAIVSGMLG